MNLDVNPTQELKPERIGQRLQRLPGWMLDREPSALARHIPFESYLEAGQLVSRVAELADARDREPEILVKDWAVTVLVSTGGVGVTEADLEFAEAISQLEAERR